MSNVIGTADTAELLGVSVRTVHRMVAQGMLSHPEEDPCIT